MTIAWQIVINTPLWVWALLGLLLWLGWRDLRARTVAPGRLAILPLVAGSISLVNVLTSARPALAVPAWLLALAAGVPLGFVVARRRRLQVDADRGRMWLAGSWFSMAVGLSIFAIRYAMAVTAAFNPGVAREAPWIVSANALGGIVAGIGLGWMAGLLLRYRRAAQATRGRRAVAGTVNPV
jgi:hypothetical protein